MKKMNNLFACLIATNLIIAGVSYTGLNANAISIKEETYSTLIPPIPQEELAKAKSYSQNEIMPGNIRVQNTQSLPSSVDLTESPYFPPIGAQGNIGSCVAWSTTYYQFTFAANKLNNIVSTQSTAYSPSWVYNWLCNGVHSETTGVERTLVYQMLSTRGCLTMADCPYYKSDGTYNSSIENDTEKQIAALETRISSYTPVYIRTSQTPIANPNDLNLNQIKTLLNNNYLLQVNIRNTYTTKRTTNNEEAACAFYQNPIGHGLTIVGYNDNIQCDINGDGIINEGEKGAFKVADSRGEEKHNSGCFWLMYDALNNTSVYSDNTNRVAAFSYGVPATGINFFYYIEVENKPVNVVALLNINTDSINNFDFSTTRSFTNPYNDNSTDVYFAQRGSLSTDSDGPGINVPFNGIIPLDYDNLDEPINIFTDSNTLFLGVYMEKRRDSSYIPPTITEFSLCDRNMNTIRSASIPNIEDGTWFRSIYAKLSVGDLDYNNNIGANDADILMKYLIGRINLSSLQFHLADVNKDGNVSMADLNTLNGMLPQSEQTVFLSSVRKMYDDMSSQDKIKYNNIFNQLEVTLEIN